jgi:hypothetical protein
MAQDRPGRDQGELSLLQVDFLVRNRKRRRSIGEPLASDPAAFLTPMPFGISTTASASIGSALPPDSHGSLDAHLRCRLLVDGYRFILVNTLAVSAWRDHAVTTPSEVLSYGLLGLWFRG